MRVVRIKFERFIRNAKLLSPLQQFEVDSTQIEYRIDPLSGYMGCIVSDKDAEWVDKFFFTNPDPKLIEEVVEKTKQNCFFCPENLEKATPKFTEDIVPEGRIHVGDASVFPNLNPYCEYSAVVVISKKHYIQLDEFTPEVFANGLHASMVFLRKLRQAKPSIRYAAIGLQYLYPAGSSIIHPHMQVLATDIPIMYVAKLLDLSAKYYQAHGVNYWKELVETEKKLGERYVGRMGNVDWYTPYTPMGFGEVHAVVTEKSSFTELTDEDVNNLGEGLSRITRYYKEKNCSTFSFVAYTGPMNEVLEHFCVGLKIVLRPHVKSLYTNDAWFMPHLLQQPIIRGTPEMVASSLRKYFDAT